MERTNVLVALVTARRAVAADGVCRAVIRAWGGGHYVIRYGDLWSIGNFDYIRYIV